MSHSCLSEVFKRLFAPIHAVAVKGPIINDKRGGGGTGRFVLYSDIIMGVTSETYNIFCWGLLQKHKYISFSAFQKFDLVKSFLRPV